MQIIKRVSRDTEIKGPKDRLSFSSKVLTLSKFSLNQNLGDPSFTNKQSLTTGNEVLFLRMLCIDLHYVTSTDKQAIVRGFYKYVQILEFAFKIVTFYTKAMPDI
jgi:hypothetical protein